MNIKLKNKITLNGLFLSVFVMLNLTGVLNAQLKEDWVSRYNKSDKNDKPVAMATDKSGHVYVTGYSEDKEDNKDIMTIKYNSSGSQIWEATFMGPENMDGSDDIANGIAVDAAGNVYVAGTTHGGFRGRDIILIKYDSNGNQRFANHFNGTSYFEDSDDEGAAVALDHEGYVIVAGNSEGSAAYDYCLLKYSVDGDLIWVNTFDGGAGSNDFVKGLRIDSEESIIVTGDSYGINSDKDYCTVKYNLEGDELWHARFNGTGGNLAVSDDEVRAIELDRFDNIFVTGYSTGRSGKDFLTVKYDTKGNEKWVTRNDNILNRKKVNSDDEANVIRIDGSGNIVVAGVSTNSQTGSDFFTVKLDEKGRVLWAENYNNEEFGGFSEDGALDAAIDAAGNIFITGYSTGFGFATSCGGSKDIATLKYSSKGQLRWIKKYNGVGRFENSDDIGRAIALDNKGGIFVMGESMGEMTEIDFCLIKYSEFIPIDESSTSVYILNDNFPNPFNPVTRISFEIPVASNVRLAIYDITGREISLLENKPLQAGSYSYDWNVSEFSSGTYFYRISAEGFMRTKKMMLVK